MHVLIEKLWGIDSIEINYNQEENQRVICKIKKELFQPGEIKSNGRSPFSVLIRRTLAQYLGQKYWISFKWAYILRSLLSMFVLPFSILLLTRGLKKPRTYAEINGEVSVVAFLGVEFYKFFLDELFPDGYTIARFYNMGLNFKDIRFIFKILRMCPRYLIYPELILRVIIRIAQYSYVINKYHPQIIANFAEGSCWSSVLTAYCRELKIKHVNIMHGVRYFSSSMAFTEFDTFYVWGEYHLEQFKKMYTSAKEFIIFGNPIHKRLHRIISNSKFSTKRLLIMCEYSLLEKNLFSLLCSLIEQIPLDWEIACRFHYQEITRSVLFVKRLERKTYRKIIEEDPRIISLEDSIKRAKIVVGYFTNALTDAWIAGRKCIYLHLPQDNKIPLREYHQSPNIIIFSPGDDIRKFLDEPVYENEREQRLKERFSRFLNSL